MFYGSKHTFLAGLVGTLMGLGAAWPVEAQTYPSKPITIVVPFTVGGGPDLLARVLAEKISPSLGQTMVIDNRPGAGGLLGASVVAKSEPDGHRLLLAPITIAISPYVLAKGAGSGVDVHNDLVPIIAPATTPMILVAHPKLGVNNLQELVALAKKNPGMTYASGGVGTPMHFAGEMLKRSADIELVHVPYRGLAPSITGTLAGDTQLLFVALGSTVAHIQDRKLIPLAVTESSRSVQMPDVPTATEQGIPNVEVNTWYGIFAPTGTPAPVLSRINSEVNKALKFADVRARLQAIGLEVLGGEPSVLAGFMKSADQRYGKLARELKMEVN